MKREAIRQLKRAVSDGQDAHAMQVLLERSVRFGHKRLALLRCLQAEHLGVAVTPETLHYCQQVADRMAPAELQRIIRQAMAATSRSLVLN